MLLSIILCTLLLLIGWFLWKYGSLFIGSDNRHKHFAKFYEGFVLFYNHLTGHTKQELFKPLHSLESKIPELRKEGRIRVLEIGVGPGANLQFYPANVDFIAVDPNPYFKDQLEANVAKHPGMKLDRFVVSGAEKMLEIADNSVDAVVSTLVMCSCNSPQQIYTEVCRILAPGGKLFYMEHVIDPNCSFLKICQWLAGHLGIFPFFFDGCHPDRNVESILHRSKFASVDPINHFRLNFNVNWHHPSLLGIATLLVKPHVYGTAVSASTSQSQANLVSI